MSEFTTWLSRQVSPARHLNIHRCVEHILDGVRNVSHVLLCSCAVVVT